MSSSIPSYEELAHQIESLPPDAKRKALVAMKSEVQNESTKKSLVEEVEKLTGAAKEIDSAFQSIRLKLVNADIIAAKDEWKDHVSYVAGWEELQKVGHHLHHNTLVEQCIQRFRTLLLKSRQNALDLSYYFESPCFVTLEMVVELTN